MAFFKAYFRGALLGAVSSLLFMIAPLVIDRYFANVPAAVSLAAALRWIGDKGLQGLTAVIVFAWVYVLCSLLNDARKLVGRAISARAALPTGPIALEEGTAVPPPPTTTDDTTTPSSPAAAPKNAPLTVGHKLLSIFSSTYFLASLIRSSIRTNTISLERPILENVWVGLKYVLRGCEVLFALFLVLMLVAAVKQQRSESAAPAPAPAPSAPAPVQMLVSVDVHVADDEKASIKEKEEETLLV
ncbi:hypothetical protein C8R45DRAFT_548509 [Mycena sanguinolenta]|nr:hypothetical protein C8R45DRAFT_548509 [Mycena sanguinolenta]